MKLAPVLETECLTLRPLELAKHNADIHKLYADEESMRFVPYLPHTSQAQTYAHFEEKMKHVGAVHWGVCLKDSQEVIGVVNFLGQTAIPGMGYIIRRDFWGQGITAEAVRAVLTYGFEHLNLDRVEFWIHSDNRASQRVADKLDFKVKGRMPMKYSYAPSYHSMLVYGIRADDWLGNEPLASPPRFFRAQPVLMVHDILETTMFYQEKLGFRLDFLYGDPPNHAGVSRGDWTGSQAVLQMTQVPAEQMLIPASYLNIFVDEKLDQIYETYKAAGVEIVQPPENFPWGLREFSIRDNNGYSIRFGMNS